MKSNIGRVEPIADHTPLVQTLVFVGNEKVPFADSYNDFIDCFSTIKPNVKLTEDDEAAIYFSSGTTGFPKAILHLHKALISSCIWEQKHHGQQKDYVSHLYIIQVLKCTGLEALYLNLRQYF